MKILYLTSALENNEYTRLLNEGYLLNNPSNQNFHDKLIRSLAIEDNVEVISFTPASCQNVPLADKDHYHYVNSKGHLFDALGHKKRLGVRYGKRLLKEGVDVILFDSLNRAAGSVALTLAKKAKIPAVAIVTDNPKNLAKAPSFFQKAFKKHLSKANGALALSETLLAAVGAEEKPHLIFAGLVEEPQSEKRLFREGSYLYFGGALSERYGVLNLLKAYSEAQPDYDLVIAGHETTNEEFPVLLAKNPRIRFLGQVSKEENYDLESHAALLINPRPYDAKLDQESIPSKLLEYLATTTPILSTVHSALQKEFPTDINWLSDSSEVGIKAFFIAHMDSEKKLVNLQANNGRKKVVTHYGLEPIGKAVHVFLQSLKTSNN
jgi:glycosyltransferase involved in cell wall biosynthesis